MMNRTTDLDLLYIPLILPHSPLVPLPYRGIVTRTILTTPMYQPLHLKYRPKNLQELVGQDTIKTTLTNAITSDKI
ncbi:hypothetical protein QT970_00615, partial [Microcoleus sp. herbarium8]